jgi:rare lipoprotein A
MVAYAAPSVRFFRRAYGGTLAKACPAVLACILTASTAMPLRADEAAAAPPQAGAPVLETDSFRSGAGAQRDFGALFAPAPMGAPQALARPAPAAAETVTKREIGRGVAAWYDLKNLTASGERFDANALTAGHRTLPFGTRVEVVNLRNGRSVTVTITDRGPFTKGRVIDLSRAAARTIGVTGIDQVALYAAPPDVTATGSVGAAKVAPPR